MGKAPLGPVFVMQTVLTQTQPLPTKSVVLSNAVSPTVVVSSHIDTHSNARADGGTPERLSPQGRTAVGRGFIRY